MFYSYLSTIAVHKLWPKGHINFKIVHVWERKRKSTVLMSQIIFTGDFQSNCTYVISNIRQAFDKAGGMTLCPHFSPPGLKSGDHTRSLGVNETPRAQSTWRSISHTAGPWESGQLERPLRRGTLPSPPARPSPPTPGRSRAETGCSDPFRR